MCKISKHLLLLITICALAISGVFSMTAFTPVHAASSDVALIDINAEGVHTEQMRSCIKSEFPKANILTYSFPEACSISDLTNAINKAMKHDVKVMNLSFAYPKSILNSTAGKNFKTAVEKALKKGIVVCVAAGNEYGDAASNYVPANIKGVIIVGSCDKNGNKLSISNKGTHYDVYSGYKFTSHATATLSGFIAKNGKAKIDSVLNKGTNNGKDNGIFQKNIAIDNAKRIAINVTSFSAYTGKAQKPKVTVKLGGRALKEGTDYTLSYKNNTKIGTGTVTITGKGFYKNSTSKNFTIGFSDVKNSSAYYYKPVMWAVSKGIISNSTKFNPNNNCLRKDLAIMLWRFSGKPKTTGTTPFQDVENMDKTKDTYKAILWCYKNKIANGISKDTFGINENVTRSDAMTMLYRVAKKPSVSGNVPFNDITEKEYPKTGDAYKAILWGVQKGIAKGYDDNTFRPLKNVSRADMVTFMHRYNK